MKPRLRHWILVFLGLAIALLLSAGMWWLGEWNIYAYSVGLGTGAMFAALGMIADKYNKWSSAQRPR
jgi:hypothetical protein